MNREKKNIIFVKNIIRQDLQDLLDLLDYFQANWNPFPFDYLTI